MSDVLPTITPEAAALAYAAEDGIKETLENLRHGWARLAGQLYDFQHRRLWEALGFLTYEEWLASPDIDLSRREVYSLVEAWRELVVQRGVAPKELEQLQVSKVRAVLPAVRQGRAELGEALADVRVLSKADLIEKYEGRPGTGPVTGGHFDAGAEDEWSTCSSCGSRYRLKTT